MHRPRRADREPCVKQGRAEGVRQLVTAAGGNANEAVVVLLADQLPALVDAQMKGISNLKIDKVFVGRLGCETEDAEIVRLIVALGQSLNLTIVAEGAENDEQIRVLAELGCHEAQGFGVATPMLGEEIERYAAATMSAASTSRGRLGFSQAGRVLTVVDGNAPVAPFVPRVVGAGAGAGTEPELLDPVDRSYGLP